MEAWAGVALTEGVQLWRWLAPRVCGGAAVGFPRKLLFWGGGHSAWWMQGPVLVERGEGCLASAKAEQMVKAAHRLGFSSV